MSDKAGQSGGITNSGWMTGTNIAGGDITVTTRISHGTALSRVREVIETAPAEVQADARLKLSQLEAEVEAAKGKGTAHDGTIAKLVDGIVGLIPAAASAIVGAFADPVLSALSGTATAAVLQRLRSA